MSWKSTTKSSCMAEHVIRCIAKLGVSRTLRPLQPAWHSHALQNISKWRYSLCRPFSVSSLSLLPRNRRRPDGYPGFRNESKERRHVREHNLFDPQSHFLDNIDDVARLPSPLEHAQILANPTSTLRRDQAPTSELERELLFLSSRSPTEPRTRNLLHQILYDRKQRPDAIHYEALILANASPSHGSADNVRKLTKEMATRGIPMNVNIYNAVLRTLVVHPDVDILNQVIEACSKLWIEVDLEMQHLICASYLRAGMPEIALEYLEHIEHGFGAPTLGVSKSGLQRGKAELWLYVVFIQELAIHSEWDAVLRLCYRLCDDTSLGIPLAGRHLDVPYAFWGWLLEQSAAAKDKWVTLWVWENWVLQAWVKPSRETCMHVLETSADRGAIRTAETASTILGFLTKDASPPKSQQDIEIPSHQSHEDLLNKAKSLLARCYENAPTGELRPSHSEIRRMTASWWMFDVQDTLGLNRTGKKGLRSLRINPWSVLRELNDPGQAWARTLSEREEVQQRREEREAFRRANTRRARIEAGRVTMVQTLPQQMVIDIQRAANVELEFDEPDEEGSTTRPETVSVTITQPATSSTPTQPDKPDPRIPQPRIRLVDPKRTRTSPEAKARAELEGMKRAKWMALDFDVDVVLRQEDPRRGRGRGWRVNEFEGVGGDGDVEGEGRRVGRVAGSVDGGSVGGVFSRVRLVRGTTGVHGTKGNTNRSETADGRRGNEKLVRKERGMNERRDESSTSTSTSRKRRPDR